LRIRQADSRSLSPTEQLTGKAVDMTGIARQQGILTKLGQIAAAAAAVTIAMPATANAEDFETFQTPSGNIVCSVYTHGEERPGATCDIVEITYQAPPPPVNCPPNPVNWGHKIKLEEGRGSYFGCGGGTLHPASQRRVLDYGPNAESRTDRL
jgi:hypothetical protein